MQVVADLDPHVLERELVRRVGAAHPRDRLSRTIVLVPTSRLALHVRSRLAAHRDAWLGLEVWPFRRMAIEILRSSGLPAPSVASRVLLDALAERELRSQQASTWAQWIQKRPGALGRLRQTLVDLREAGLDPGEVDAVLDQNARERDLASLYRAYSRALDDWLREGWTDDAGLVRAALPFAARHVTGTTAVFVHGAYELIGVNLDLLREVERAAPVTVLLPGGAAGPAGKHSLAFARRFLAEPEPVAAEPSPLACLYSEDARPPAAPAGRYLFRHAQGAAAEVKVAVREALRAAARGTPASDIAITARSLGPYAAALEEVFSEEGLPWTTSSTAPLGREPWVRDFLLVLEVVARGFPRRPTVELLRSPRVRWSALCRSSFVEADLADVWSRQAKIIGGFDEWSSLPARMVAASRVRDEATLERRKRIAESLVDVLTALAERVDVGDKSYAEHATAFGRILHELFTDGDSAAARQPAVDLLRELLDDMARVETLLGDTRTVPFESARSWLVRAVEASELPRADGDGGIRVLDAMQMRGMTCRHLHVLGMNAAIFPRVVREDPFLPDDRRAALAARSGRPLPLKSLAADEERLILAMLLGAASERTVVSWQRADESGRAKTPSLALREVARLALGRPDLDELRRAAEHHVPSHPTHALEWLAEHVGLLSPADGRLLAALYGQEARLAAELSARYPELTPGLELLRATQAFATIDPAYDAHVGPLAAGLDMSVSAFETLGQCPLKFFFAHVLRVRELDEPASAFELAAKELGSAVHDLLHTVYRTLADEGAFAWPAPQLVARGLELAERERSRILGEAAERLSRRLPLLWGEVVRQQSLTIESFIRDDLARLHAAGLAPVALEGLRRHEVTYGELRQVLTAKFDRELAGPAGIVVGDYKVSKQLADRVKIQEMLQGKRLQMPLYRMLAGEGAAIEILGIHPELDLDAGEHRVRFAGFEPPDEANFSDTLRTLVGFKHEGAFPFHGDRHCTWCVYARACRRQHPPSRERQATTAAGGALLRLRAKKAGTDVA